MDETFLQQTTIFFHDMLNQPDNCFNHALKRILKVYSHWIRKLWLYPKETEKLKTWYLDYRWWWLFNFLNVFLIIKHIDSISVSFALFTTREINQNSHKDGRKISIVNLVLIINLWFSSNIINKTYFEPILGISIKFGLVPKF